MLFFGLSNAAQAAHKPAPSDVMKTDAQDDRQGFQSDDDKHMNAKQGNSRAEGDRRLKANCSASKTGTISSK